MTFADYIQHYGLARSEGLVLRYLTDAYKALVQTVPDDAKTEDVRDLTEWLGEMVRQVDSSLLDEWDQLRAGVEPTRIEHDRPPPPPPGVTANARAFRVMVRNEAFKVVERLARRGSEWDEQLGAYWAAHESIGTGPDARGPALFQVEERAGEWLVRQVLDDPAGDHDWAVRLRVDLAASDEAGAPVVEVLDVSDAP